jgi:hypothetical protein
MSPHRDKTWVFTAPHSARLDELLVALGSTNEIAAVDYHFLGKKIAEVTTQVGTHPHSKRSSQRRPFNHQRDRA